MPIEYAFHTYGDARKRIIDVEWASWWFEYGECEPESDSLSKRIDQETADGSGRARNNLGIVLLYRNIFAALAEFVKDN